MVIRSLKSLGKTGDKTDLRNIYLQGIGKKLVINNPPYHLLTDAGLGGFPIKPFFLGVIWVLSGGILKLSMMTLARCILPSKANLSMLKEATRIPSV